MRNYPNLRWRLLLTGAMLISIGGLATMPPTLQGQTLYDFGNPSSDAQLYVELINRARANPPAEGLRLATTTDADVLSYYGAYNVNLGMMQNEFNVIAALPPLAPNAILTSISRSHSAWMLANGIQSHNQTNPYNTPFTRMTDAGYIWASTFAGENVNAYAISTWHGHVGFEVDWYPGGTGGMLNPRGHRNNIHSPNFREIGVGVVYGTNGAVGPQLVTQDFGARAGAPSFGTGVAYYDLNGNNFYDVGEGISGLTVNVTGASYYCTTAAGGGWVVPIPSAASTRTVTFSGLGVNQTASLSNPLDNNAKADLKLIYSPPTISSSSSAYNGISHTITFNSIAGASGYKWNRWNLADAAAEDCESLTGITTSTTSGYAVRSTTVKQQGTSSFHLLTHTGVNQSFELNGLYYGQSSPSISFQSRLRTSTSTQKHKAQIKEEGSIVWQDVYSQNGTGNSGETVFTLRSAALSGMTGKAFRVRFLLEHAGAYYPNTSDSVGWFIDAISFTNVSTLSNQNTQVLAGSSGSFSPATGSYLMSVAPTISNSDFPGGYQILTVTEPPPPAPGFPTWAAAHESGNSLPAGTLADPNGDYDHDGLANLVEYAFGTSPLVGNDASPKVPSPSTTATDFILNYQRDTSLTDITYTAQASPTMENWKAPGDPGAPAGFTDSLISTVGTIQTRQATFPRSTTPYFMRVRITRP